MLVMSSVGVPVFTSITSWLELTVPNCSLGKTRNAGAPVKLISDFVSIYKFAYSRRNAGLVEVVEFGAVLLEPQILKCEFGV